MGLPDCGASSDLGDLSISLLFQEILEPGKPVQLVGLDDDGDLCLDEEALSRCLEQGQVKNAPVCLVSILGEQRRGKSFLLNFLLRRLQNLVGTSLCVCC